MTEIPSSETSLPGVDVPAEPDAGTAADATTEGWWGFESDSVATPWKPAETPHLKHLLDVPSRQFDVDGHVESTERVSAQLEQYKRWNWVDDEVYDDKSQSYEEYIRERGGPTQPTNQFAWEPDLELDIRGQGGLVSKERRRYTLVGHKGYFMNQVDRHQKLTAEHQSSRVARERMVSVKRPDDVQDLDASWGVDRLAVGGSASYRVGSRTLMMSGSVDRLWNGGVVRMSCMEGVICAGVFARVIAGPSATLSGMMTGDVYGGCARVSAVRAYVALLQYRAAKSAVWASGVYVRNATFVIEPVVGSPASGTPPSRVAAKMARLATLSTRAGKMVRRVTRMTQKIGRTRVWRAATKAGRGVKAGTNAARTVCPVVDIIAGLVTLPLAFAGIGMFFASFFMKPLAPEEAGTPRTRIRTTGTTLQAFTSMTFL